MPKKRKTNLQILVLLVGSIKISCTDTIGMKKKKGVGHPPSRNREEPS